MNTFVSLCTKAISASTCITFSQGETRGASKILDVAHSGNGKIVMILDKTPFHPVDGIWPDQPADIGIVKIFARIFAVQDCQVFAVHKETQEIKISKDVPRKDKGSWHYVVGHIISPEEIEPESFIGQEVEVEVEKSFRDKISLHHSASHLAAFAFNLATKGYWTKEAPKKDSLGSPNIDQLAIDTSLIFADHCEDRYRFGQSIKKKGLKVEQLFAELDTIQNRVDELLKQWLATSADVAIHREGEALDDRRIWSTELPQGLAEMPCGGTHVNTLSAFQEIQYKLQKIEEPGNQEKILFAITRALSATTNI